MHTIKDTVDAYLSEIKNGADPETYKIHRSVINDLLEWIGDDNLKANKDNLNSQLAAHYIQKCREIDGKDDSEYYITIKTVLENLIAFATQSDPDVVALHISEEQVYVTNELDQNEVQTPPIPSYPHEHAWASHGGSLISQAASELREYLDAYRYGSLPHAYVEVLYTIDGQSHYVHHLDLDDIDFDQQTLYIEFDSDALVVDLGLVTEHAAPFTDYTAEILQEYLDTERGGDSNTDALFADEDGRISEVGLHTSFSNAVENAGKTVGVEKSSIESYRDMHEEEFTPEDVVKATKVPDFVIY